VARGQKGNRREAESGERRARNTSMVLLFGDERCTAAILEFLATTAVGLRGGRAWQLEGDEEDGREEDDREEDDEGAPVEGGGRGS
jgi:hypothetical protein